MSAIAAWVGRRPYVVALVVLVVGHITLIASRTYVPAGDWAFLELRTSDVFSRHTPLTGAWSRYGWNHPGPFLYDALAIPHVLTGGSWRGLWLGAMTLNVTAIVVAVWLTEARSRLLAAALALAAVWAVAAGPDHLFTDPWNASVVVLPVITIVAASVAVRSGDRRGVMVACIVFVASAQSHAAYGVLLLPLVVVVLVVAWRRWWRWTAISVAVGALMCLPALVDTLVDPPGNLWRAIRFTLTSDEPAVGFGEALRVVGRSTSLTFFTDPILPSFVATVAGTPWGLAPFAGLVALGAGWFTARRHDWRVWSRAAEGVALVWTGGLLMTARTRGPLLIWLTSWTLVAAALTWCLAAGVAVQWLLARRAARDDAGVLVGATNGSPADRLKAGGLQADGLRAHGIEGDGVDVSADRAQRPVVSDASATAGTAGGADRAERPDEVVGAGPSGRRVSAAVAAIAAVSVVLAVVDVAGSVGVGYPFQEQTAVIEQFARDAAPYLDQPVVIDLEGDEYLAGAVQSGLIGRLDALGTPTLGRPDQRLQLGEHRVGTDLEPPRLLVQVVPRRSVAEDATVVSVVDPLDEASRATVDRLMDELTAVLITAGLADRVGLLANDLAPLAALNGPPEVIARLSDFERLGELHARGPRFVLQYLPAD